MYRRWAAVAEVDADDQHEHVHEDEKDEDGAERQDNVREHGWKILVQVTEHVLNHQRCWHI